MIHWFNTVHDYVKALEENPGRWHRYSLSPGGVAGALGITRAAVYKAMNEGRIDAVRTKDHYILVDEIGAKEWRLKLVNESARKLYMDTAHQKQWQVRRRKYGPSGMAKAARSGRKPG